MSTNRKEWGCCGSVTETDCWEPDECPFCSPSGEIVRLRNALEHIAGSCEGRAAEIARCALEPPNAAFSGHEREDLK